MAELVDALDLGSSDISRVGSIPPPVPKNFMKIEELKQTKDLNVEWKIVIPAPEINVELSKKYSDIQKELKYLDLGREKFQ